MKPLLLKSGLLTLVFGAMSISGMAQAQKKADKQTEAWRYEIEAVATGAQGSYLVKVWSYSKKPNVATEQGKKNAVHGIIFKGFIGKAGVPTQKPLTNNPSLEQERAEFFEEFFNDGGKYMKFVSLSNSGSVGGEDVMKVGKEYKVGIVVSVNVAALRKDLEAAGVIKGLGSGF